MRLCASWFTGTPTVMRLSQSTGPAPSSPAWACKKSTTSAASSTTKSQPCCEASESTPVTLSVATPTSEPTEAEPRTTAPAPAVAHRPPLRSTRSPLEHKAHRWQKAMFSTSDVAPHNRTVIAGTEVVHVVEAGWDALDFEAFSRQDWRRLGESHAPYTRMHSPDAHYTDALDRHMQDITALRALAPDLPIEARPHGC